MRITVIGTGYVGLTVGTCFAETGHEVVCVDIDQNKVDLLARGILPIYEPGLQELVERNSKAGRLEFTTDIVRGMQHGEIVISAVGTPPGKDHRADLTAVLEVAQLFGTHAQDYKLFVNKSTVPVGTGMRCARIIQEELSKRNATFGFDVVSNPEFLREGTAVADSLKPDRIVIGTNEIKARELMMKAYAPIIEKGSVFFATDIVSAEIIKYASNSLLATKISFMNEIARFCEKVGANIIDVERGVGLDQRIGRRFLHAGIGYGGSCFPKDVDALLMNGVDVGSPFTIIQSVQQVNEKQKTILVEKLLSFVPDLHGKRVALWGLAFKPKTDDMREAPSLIVIDQLQKAGAVIIAYDPVAIEQCKRVIPDIQYVTSAHEAIAGADILLVLTEWDEFRSIDFADLKKLMRGSIIGDGRNIWLPDEVRAHGFTYFSIGRQ